MSQLALTYTKDPDERIAFKLTGWDRQMAVGDTIASSAWTYNGLTESGSAAFDAVNHTTTSRKVAAGTHGTDYVVENTVTTTGGDILQAHVLVRVRS